MTSGEWRGTRGASFALAVVWFVVVFLAGATAAQACDPDKAIRVGIAPVEVKVPVGGNATVTTITTCRTDDDDWAPGATLTTGGTIVYDIRLMDEDGIDDTLGTHTHRQPVLRGIRTFNWPQKVPAMFQIQCPQADPEITGTPDNSGEGQPGGGDPADLVLEVDHGSSTESANHYASNTWGATVPAYCVLPEDEEVSWTSGARDAFLVGGSELKHICYEVAIAPAGQRQVPVPHCDYVPANAFGRFQNMGGPSVISGQDHQIFVEAEGAMPGRLDLLWDHMNGMEPHAASARTVETMQATPFTLTVTGAAPFVNVTGQVQPDGSFVLNGVGTVAGFPNISVQMTGTLTAGNLVGDYSMGSAGGLPGGYPIVYHYDIHGLDWEAFWTRMGQVLEDTAQAIATLNFEAPLGGVDFSTATVNIAGQLLVASAALQSLDLDPEEVDLREWVDEALNVIQLELTQLADEVAASTLVSRVQTEFDLRQAALGFGEASVLRQQINTLSDEAPSQILSDTINQWMYALAQAGLALQAVSASALGDPWTTVSGASYLGPEVAPDSIVSGFGADLALATEGATVTPLPTTLSNRSIRVTDSEGAERLAGLFYGSAGQFNFHIPAGTALGPAALTLYTGDQVVATGRVFVRDVEPGLFSAAASGAGVAAAHSLHVAADGTRTQFPVFDTALAPAPISLGSEGESVYLLLYGTGIHGYTLEVTATVGGESVPVLGAVAQGEFVGLDQVNIGPLPRSLAGKGIVDIILTVDGKTANTVTVRIQ